ncbi:hypothetical protein GUI12_04155 [Anaplasmataceae bacterium AB001_6]|nr:hypothetical protein GUI12_04155 [Anaplasmataceae bacterium AB001_6]
MKEAKAYDKTTNDQTDEKLIRNTLHSLSIGIENSNLITQDNKFDKNNKRLSNNNQKDRLLNKEFIINSTIPLKTGEDKILSVSVNYLYHKIAHDIHKQGFGFSINFSPMETILLQTGIENTSIYKLEKKQNNIFHLLKFPDNTNKAHTYFLKTAYILPLKAKKYSKHITPYVEFALQASQAQKFLDPQNNKVSSYQLRENEFMIQTILSLHVDISQNIEFSIGVTYPIIQQKTFFADQSRGIYSTKLESGTTKKGKISVGIKYIF